MPADLTRLSEWHDLTRTAEAEALARELRGERELTPDLLQARPWLAQQLGLAEDAGLAEQSSLSGLLRTLLALQGPGFLARLGRVGPWVYVADVAEVQRLSARYAAVVAQTDSHESGPLTARLRATQMWPRSPARLPFWRRQAATAVATAPEADFWAAAQALARPPTRLTGPSDTETD